MVNASEWGRRFEEWTTSLPSDVQATWELLTNDGVAIHGSSVREGWATHGCIGVPLDFARLLFAAATKGTEVVILPA